MSSQIDQQKATSDDEDEQTTSMYMEIDPDSLLDALAPVTQLVDEAKIRVNENGLSTKAVDAANVGMVDMHIDASEFETLRTNDLVLGVNLDRFTKQVNNISSEPVGDEDQMLHVKLDNKTRKLHIWATPGSMEFTMALVDPDSIRDEPDLPGIDLPGSITMSSSYFDHAVKTANNFAEHLTLAMDGDSNEFSFAAHGDTDDWEAVLDEEHHNVLDLHADTVQSIYSLDYFNSVRKGLPNDVEIEIELGHDFPTRIMTELMDSNVSVTYMIAPRIQADD